MLQVIRVIKILRSEVNAIQEDWRRLTDLEKATQVTALSNTPIPSTWSVLRLTESHTRT